MFAGGFGSIGISLDAPATVSLSGGIAHFEQVPLTVYLSITCNTRCEDLEIPLGTSEVSVQTGGEVHFGPLVADFIYGNVVTETVSVDLGLGAIPFTLNGAPFRGSTSTESP
jgi:hypothetical protein